MRRALSPGGCAAILVLTACAASIVVHDEPAPGTNLTSLHTFAWDGGRVIRREFAAAAASNLEGIVDRALLEGLAARGYRRNSEQANFRVSYTVVVEEKVVETTFREFESPRLGDRGRGGREIPIEFVYDEGTLSIELRDAESRELVWRGWAEAEVKLDASAEERGVRAREAIRLLLERLPAPYASTNPRRSL
jgi:hypothetical protein